MCKKLSLLFVLLTGVNLLVGCNLKKETQFSGKTMGTSYHIKVVSGYFTKVSHLEKKIEMCLEGINRSMSTYQEDSEISRFNAIEDTTQTFHTTKDFFTVMSLAKDVFTKTQGAWDGSVDPLVNLWGFGRKGTLYQIPSQKEIEIGLSQVGFNHIEFLPNQTLKKSNPHIKIDLASIAKGHGVDQVVTLLRNNHITDFLVEIGGEVYAAGKRKDGQKWRVGINEPRPDAPINAVYKVVEIENKGFATSGDYRNFIEIEGKRYSHIIDPRSGWPVNNGVVSVSILANTCAMADGLATAIMVMGPEKGQALLNRLDAVEGLILTTTSNNKLKEYPSKGFNQSLLKGTDKK
ncbi:MAG: FAD:protein FMN transferase [Desulfobacteraceae bacterium]|jgi:thiamine biosynthesis lipoprotein